MIDTDITGEPCGRRQVVHAEWAILVDSLANGQPGPHLLPCEQGEAHARLRLNWWRTRCPEGNARLMRQEVVTSYDVWMVAADQHAEPIVDHRTRQ